MFKKGKKGHKKGIFHFLVKNHHFSYKTLQKSFFWKKIFCTLANLDGGSHFTCVNKVLCQSMTTQKNIPHFLNFGELISSLTTFCRSKNVVPHQISLISGAGISWIFCYLLNAKSNFWLLIINIQHKSWQDYIQGRQQQKVRREGGYFSIF